MGEGILFGLDAKCNQELDGIDYERRILLA